MWLKPKNSILCCRQLKLTAIDIRQENSNLFSNFANQ